MKFRIVLEARPWEHGDSLPVDPEARQRYEDAGTYVVDGFEELKAELEALDKAGRRWVVVKH